MSNPAPRDRAFAAQNAPAEAAIPAGAQALTKVQAAVAPLQPLSQLADPATAAPRWRRWIGRLYHYFRTTRETDGTVKRSMMLHVGGDELDDLFKVSQTRRTTTTMTQQ